MNRKLLESALIFTLTAAMLAWLIYRYEASLLDALIPVFRTELEWLMPGFHLDYLGWKIEHHETVIALSVTLAESRVMLGHLLSPGGMSLDTSTLAAHAWVHPVLLFSLLAAWPDIAWQRKPFLLLVGLPFVVIAELFDVPLMLWGSLEDFIYFQIDPARVSESIGSRVLHVLDGGGRYALSLLFALVSVVLFRRLCANIPAAGAAR